MSKKRSTSSVKKSSPLTPLIIIIVVLIGIFLTVNMLQSSNSDVRSRATNSNNPGIGSGVSEEVSASLQLTRPKVNETISNPVIVKADIPTGHNTERIQFFIDNDKVPFSEVFEAPFEASVELSPGRHRVHIFSYDQEGNVKRSQDVTFQVR